MGEVMEALDGDADLESLLIDSTVVRAHQHSAGAEKKRRTGPRPLAGGMSTKVHVGVDALGHPLRLIATAGQVADVTQGEALVQG